MRVLVAIHLIGVVLWMGGLLNLSRILAYHAKERPAVRPRFSFLEARLNYFVTLPGAVIVLATGLSQLSLEPTGYFAIARWLHIKLTLVFVVAAIHLVVTLRHRSLARERADQPINKALFSALHGTLGLLLIAIIVLAVIKP